MRRLEQPRTISKLPMRILLGVTFLPAAGLVTLWLMGGNDTLFIYFWVYVALLALGLTLLMSMAVLGINHRIRDKSTRKYVTIALATLVALLAYAMGGLCWAFAQAGETPDGFYPSPDGARRVVVMRSISDENGTIAYTAYPMTSGYFYRPTMDETARIIAGSARYAVEWIGEDVARVYLPEPGEAPEPHSIEVTFEADELPES